MVRVLTAIAVSLGVAFFAYGVASGRPLWVNLVFMLGIIVANVPEGLLPTLTLALAMGSQRMARRNVLVKSLSAVEALGAVHVICTDKTGTLTRNELTLTHNGVQPSDLTPDLAQAGSILQLTSGILEAQVEHLLVRLVQVTSQLDLRQVANLTWAHPTSPPISPPTNRAALGSL